MGILILCNKCYSLSLELLDSVGPEEKLIAVCRTCGHKIFKSTPSFLHISDLLDETK